MRYLTTIPIRSVLIAGILLFGNRGGIASEGRHPLWVIEENGSRIYLLGSIHVLPRPVSAADPLITKALESSARVYFETEPAEPKEANPDRVFFEDESSYRKGDSLDQHLSKEAKDLLHLVLPMFGVQSATIQKWKPWLVAIQLQQTLYRSKSFAAQGVDEYYLELARKKRKRLGGLETTRAQLRSFTGMNDAEQNAYLIQTIEGLMDLKPQVEILGKAWKSGETNLFEQLADGCLQSKAGRQLLMRRNRLWLPKIEQMLTQKTNALIIVGMGHVVGKEGVVALLRAKGHSIRQL